jgi:hypothetical protein
MGEPGHNEPLLADVLDAGIAADFRENLLNETLRLAWRRRRFRQARRAASVLAVVAALGLALWDLSPPSGGPPKVPAKPYRLVSTRPLPQAAWVDTKAIHRGWFCRLCSHSPSRRHGQRKESGPRD